MSTLIKFKRDLIQTSKILILFLAITLGTNYLFADWSPPTALPPSCPAGSPGCNPPLDTGTETQAKAGSFIVGASSVPSGAGAYTGLGYLLANEIVSSGASLGQNGLTLEGPLELFSGNPPVPVTPTAGQVLESYDNQGDLQWANVGSSATTVYTGTAQWIPNGDASTYTVPNQNITIGGSGTYNTSIYATYGTCQDFPTNLVVDGVVVNSYQGAGNPGSDTAGCDQNTLMAVVPLVAGTHTLSLTRTNTYGDSSNYDAIGEVHFSYTAISQGAVINSGISSSVPNYDSAPAGFTSLTSNEGFSAAMTGDSTISCGLGYYSTGFNTYTDGSGRNPGAVVCAPISATPAYTTVTGFTPAANHNPSGSSSIGSTNYNYAADTGTVTQYCLNQGYKAVLYFEFNNTGGTVWKWNGTNWSAVTGPTDLMSVECGK
jgi:hypothetical protein